MLKDMRSAFDRLASRVDTVETSVVDLTAAVSKITSDCLCKEVDQGQNHNI